VAAVPLAVTLLRARRHRAGPGVAEPAPRVDAPA
jgi:hypothetical protein